MSSSGFGSDSSPTPGWSAGPRKTEIESLHRRPRACDSCFKRKIKCDAALPACNWCQHHGIACKFTREPQLRKPRAPKRSKTELDVRDLEARVNFIEKLWTDTLRTTPSSETTSTSKLRRVVTPTPGRFHFAGLRIGNVNSYSGIPFFSSDGRQWIQDLTGEGFLSKRISTLAMPWERQEYDRVSLLSTHDLDSIKLPDRHIAEASASSLLRSAAARRYPIFDDMLTPTAIITRAYREDLQEYTIEDMSAQACVFAFVAYDHVFSPYGHCDKSVDTEYWIAKAQQLLQAMMMAPATINGLRTAILLILVNHCGGYLCSADVLIAVAARFVFALGAHTMLSAQDFESPSSHFEKETHRSLRRLFWICYAMDKEVSIRTGRPPALADEYCDLTPPWEQDDDSPGDQQHVAPQMFYIKVRLNLIKSKAYNTLYSTASLRKTDAEILRSIRELDDELEQWRLSLPLTHRPPMSFSPIKHLSSSAVIGRTSLIYYLDYYHCVAIFHQASSRCKAWNEGISGEIDAVSSSLALSIEASRSSLIYLLASGYLCVPDDSFWVTIFFPVSALLTLFCNILLDPLNPSASQDVQIMREAEDVLEDRARNFEGASLSSRKIQHLRVIYEFVSELVRLANSAIWRAQSAQDMEMQWALTEGHNEDSA